MPIYGFYNPTNDEEFEVDMSYDDMKKFAEEHDHLERRFRMNLGDPVKLGITKQGSDMREVLNKVKKHHPHGTINTGNISEV